MLLPDVSMATEDRLLTAEENRSDRPSGLSLSIVQAEIRPVALPGVGDRREARADVGALDLEAPQERGGVDARQGDLEVAGEAGVPDREGIARRRRDTRRARPGPRALPCDAPAR